eukprot:TRINITY_DN5548_c1_g1_i1.p1 TRINITY_DN5548_c1_g1~~TRINITY_DN5548_c1_g1_i1.p1  ORF type:complete len:440 (+),score=24.42 TRINITY_DN5548_c1_g1_i1:119-1438(+)
MTRYREADPLLGEQGRSVNRYSVVSIVESEPDSLGSSFCGTRHLFTPVCLIHVFSYLGSMKELCEISTVCKEWRRVGTLDVFWKPLCEVLRKGWDLPPPSGEPEDEIRQANEDFNRSVLESTQRVDVRYENGVWCRKCFKKFLLQSKPEDCLDKFLSVRRFCGVGANSSLDKLAGPFVLVFFAVTFVFGTIPNLSERIFQVCSWLLIFGSLPSTASSDSSGDSTSAISSAGLGVNWMIQQAALIPLIGWRVTSWSRCPMLTVSGTAIRVVHILLAIAPVGFFFVQQFGFYYSASLAGLHIAVAVEWYTVVKAYFLDSPDWHAHSHSPWHDSLPGSMHATAFRLICIHAVIALLQDLVLLTWAFQLDTDELPVYAAVAPFWLLSSFIVFGCTAGYGYLIVMLMRAKCPCFIGVMCTFLSICVTLSVLAMPIPLGLHGSPC